MQCDKDYKTGDFIATLPETCQTLAFSFPSSYTSARSSYLYNNQTLTRQPRLSKKIHKITKNLVNQGYLNQIYQSAKG